MAGCLAIQSSTATAPTPSFILDQSVKTCVGVILVFHDAYCPERGILDWSSHIHLSLQWSFVSWDHNRAFCVPGGKLGVHKGQTNSALTSAEAMTASTLKPKGWAGGRVMPPLPFGLGAYASFVSFPRTYVILVTIELCIVVYISESLKG